MNLTPRLQLMNWLVSQGLTGMPENDLIRRFCERCRAEGLELSRGLVFIDTLHPIFEGRGFRWTDSETNESESFEYGPTDDSDAAGNWRRSTFYRVARWCSAAVTSFCLCCRRKSCRRVGLAMMRFWRVMARPRRCLDL